MTLTPEQLALRRSGVSASEVAALVGESPYLTPFDLWCLKQPSAPRVQQNTAMGFGTHLEAAILGIYSERVAPAVSVGSVTLRHPKHPLALATLDGRVVNEARAVECKAVSWSGERAWYERTAPPAHVHIQCQWQMLVADLPEVDVAALFGLEEFKTFRITRDDALIEMLVDAAERFWSSHILTGIPPAITGSERSRHLITKLHPRQTGPMVPWTPDAYVHAALMAAAKADMRAAKARADDAANHLRVVIGDAAGIGDDVERVMWTAEKTGRVDWKAVATAAGATPEMIAAHRGAPGRKMLLRGFDNDDEGDETT